MSGRHHYSRRLRAVADGVRIAADIQADAAVNVGEDSRTTVARSTQDTAIVQSPGDSDEEDIR